MLRVRDLGEFGLIRLVRSVLEEEIPMGPTTQPEPTCGPDTRWRTAGGLSRLLVGLGDDSAAFCLDGRACLLAMDMLVEGRDFRRETLDWRKLGHKMVAAATSDIAAMGGDALWAVLGLVLPESGDDSVDDILALCRGARDLATRYGCRIVGGDLSGGSTVMLSSAVLGAMPPGLLPVTRSGARPGDLLAVTGTLGASRAGLALLEHPQALALLKSRDGKLTPPADRVIAAHLTPEPRLKEGRLLAHLGATAMIDISDGLGSDLERLAEASSVSLVVDAEAIPLDPAVPLVVEALAAANGTALDTIEATALRLALRGGEDFELLTAISPELYPVASRSLQGIGTPLTVIGRAGQIEDKGRSVVLHQGRPLTDLGGWEHFPPRPTHGVPD